MKYRSCAIGRNYCMELKNWSPKTQAATLYFPALIITMNFHGRCSLINCVQSEDSNTLAAIMRVTARLW